MLLESRAARCESMAEAFTTASRIEPSMLGRYSAV
jgi:hypothetical protein